MSRKRLRPCVAAGREEPAARHQHKFALGAGPRRRQKMPRRRFYSNLYFQVLVGIAAGVIVGLAAPERAVAMKPLGDGFIKLVRMLIGPVVFTTVSVGIAQMGAMKEIGRIGLRTLLYFEIT